MAPENSIANSGRSSDPSADGPHYSSFTIGGGLIFVSGQLPFKPGRDTSLATAPFKVQTEQTLANLKAVLESAGVGLAQVVKTTVYLTDMDDWGEIDAAYRAFFGAARPARTVVSTGPLHFGFGIEIDAIALAPAEK